MLSYTYQLNREKEENMAGFTDWLKENAMVAFIPTAILASMVVEANPTDLILALAATFGITFMVVSIVRLIKLAIER